MPKPNKVIPSFLFLLIVIAITLGFKTKPAHAVSPQQATPVPFACEGVLYQVISGQLKKLDFTTGLYQDVGDYTGFDRINAMGYSLDDDFLYA